jgi:hypothetical protein
MVVMVVVAVLQIIPPSAVEPVVPMVIAFLIGAAHKQR